ncbi:unnamed protein product [Ceratitis capitata]|uniref:(Mediterranean fruit fly) hypothetical protein n=1 Tax=Ceratitis capitata TaxID=7213 RepID=A0A811ULB2_CERCA|nr:unnamed protein product [Ceratitis capitata]
MADRNPSVKPAATGFVAAFGFGGTSIANTGFTNCSLGNTSGGLFNSTLKWRAKIGYTFFKTAHGLFGGGGTSTFGTSSILSGGSEADTLRGGYMSLSGLGDNQKVPLHQQLLAKQTQTRATNPAAQKTILEATMNQLKVFSRYSMTFVRVKPITSALTRNECEAPNNKTQNNPGVGSNTNTSPNRQAPVIFYAVQSSNECSLEVLSTSRLMNFERTRKVLGYSLESALYRLPLHAIRLDQFQGVNRN